MSFTTFSRNEFNQDISYAKRATHEELVFITDHGNPAHELLNIEECRRLSCSPSNIIDLLGMPGVEDIAFDPPSMGEMSGRQ